jgi:nucleotide-binding universal stress UspA family protein
MTWRDILVHVKPHEGSSEHVDVAIRLARSFGAQLTGLYTLPDATLQPRYAMLASKAEHRFRKALAVNEVSGDWQIGEGDASELLVIAGRFHDLIVVKQTDPHSTESGPDIPEECAISSGVPALVVPFQGAFPETGHHALVAWNQSREAAVAVHAALPLIARAQKVTILIGRGKGSFRGITRYPHLDIIGYLSKYAASIATHAFEAADWEAGPRILQVAGETGADVIVMGAYGHARWRELILGGATRHILKNMTVPVLMAH